MSLYRIARYVVEYWEDSIPPVSYNCGIGSALARQCALYNARNYGGTVIAQYTDGSTEEIDTRMGTPVLGEKAA